MGSKKKNKVSVGDSAGDGENGKGKQVIADPRFSKVHSDPRFQRLPKHKAKVAIDERFNRMFTDKRFAGSLAPLDKRGKPKKHSENALRRYYRQEEDEEQENRKKKVKSLESESSDESPESESDLESDVSTSTTDTDDEADDADMTEGDASDEVENVPLIEKETHRLAVVNMDWSQVKAVDLFVMLSSFLPKGGQIKSVAVYPSEFGLQRMQEEAVRGPALLFDDEKKDNDNEEEDDDDEIDTEKLRAYEKSRLRYYYAVVECDSVATADYLYKTCDGVEFERSSNVLDLRFIPDSMEFKHPPRDVAKEAPTDYDGLDFHTRALQHSNVLLSWDDDEPHRLKKLRRKYTEEQLAELELNEFLASEESENDEDENDNDNEDASGKKEKKLEMYRALVQSGDGSEEDDDDGQDMEVTFNTGLEDLSNKILQKKDKGSETVWEAYLRKRKEKKKARKSRSKNSSDDESDESDQEPPEQPDDFFEEEPPGERTKKVGHPKKNRKKESLEKAAEASRAELELLLADEKGAGDKVKGYKIKQKKGKKGKEALDEEKIPAVDDHDPRFSALFTNPGFALDPTDPQFKRSAPYFRQLAQKQQKGREEQHTDNGPMELPGGTPSDSVENEKKQAIDTSKKEKNELSTIVKSLKMKSQQISVPSRVKSKKEKMGSKGSAAKEKKHNLPSLDRPKKKKLKV